MAGYDRLTPEGEKFYAQIKELKKLEVRVGFQSDGTMAAMRDKDGNVTESKDVTMLDIAMWNELGTENAPARPFLRQTADNNKSKIITFCVAQANKIAQGGTAESCLKNIGVFAKGLVQQQIVDGDFEPNAPSTIRKKGSDKPLIDTGRLRQSVNYVIKQKGGG